jgi:hypothetical protein
VGHHEVQKMMELLGYRKIYSLWIPRLLTEEHKTGWELLSHPPHSPDLAPSDYHLFGLLKDNVRGHHYENDEAVQEAVRSWLRGAGTNFNCRGIFLQRYQECTDRDWDFVEK